MRFLCANLTGRCNDPSAATAASSGLMEQLLACVSRSRTSESSEDGPAGIFVPGSGEYHAEENQDGEVLLMAEEQALRRAPQNLRVYKIMVH
jgi:hypothetical protein